MRNEFVNFRFSINFPGFYDAKWDQAIVETNIDVGLGEGVFTNIAGYRKFRSSAGADIDGTPQSFFHAFFEIDQDQLSDELRLPEGSVTSNCQPVYTSFPRIFVTPSCGIFWAVLGSFPVGVRKTRHHGAFLLRPTGISPIR